MLSNNVNHIEAIQILWDKQEALRLSHLWILFKIHAIVPVSKEVYLFPMCCINWINFFRFLSLINVWFSLWWLQLFIEEAYPSCVKHGENFFLIEILRGWTWWKCIFGKIMEFWIIIIIIVNFMKKWNDKL